MFPSPTSSGRAANSDKKANPDDREDLSCVLAGSREALEESRLARERADSCWSFLEPVVDERTDVSNGRARDRAISTLRGSEALMGNVRIKAVGSVPDGGGAVLRKVRNKDIIGDAAERRGEEDMLGNVRSKAMCGAGWSRNEFVSEDRKDKGVGIARFGSEAVLGTLSDKAIGAVIRGGEALLGNMRNRSISSENRGKGRKGKPVPPGTDCLFRGMGCSGKSSLKSGGRRGLESSIWWKYLFAVLPLLSFVVWIWWGSPAVPDDNKDVGDSRDETVKQRVFPLCDERFLNSLASAGKKMGMPEESLRWPSLFCASDLTDRQRWLIVTNLAMMGFVYLSLLDLHRRQQELRRKCFLACVALATGAMVVAVGILLASFIKSRWDNCLSTSECRSGIQPKLPPKPLLATGDVMETAPLVGAASTDDSSGVLWLWFALMLATTVYLRTVSDSFSVQRDLIFSGEAGCRKNNAKNNAAG